MTERTGELHTTFNNQVEHLIELISDLDQRALTLPCPGREKLGDGTVGAIIKHTTDNYQRIADFVTTSDHATDHARSARHAGHRIPRLFKAVGHRAPNHEQHAADGDGHDDQYTADDLKPNLIVTQLVATQGIFGRIAELTDAQLDTIPPKDSFRFCDGQRTLEQVLASLLKHQRHQLDALDHALAGRRAGADVDAST